MRTCAFDCPYREISLSGDRPRHREIDMHATCPFAKSKMSARAFGNLVVTTRHASLRPGVSFVNKPMLGTTRYPPRWRRSANWFPVKGTARLDKRLGRSQTVPRATPRRQCLDSKNVVARNRGARETDRGYIVSCRHCRASRQSRERPVRGAKFGSPSDRPAGHAVTRPGHPRCPLVWAIFASGKKP